MKLNVFWFIFPANFLAFLLLNTILKGDFQTLLAELPATYWLMLGAMLCLFALAGIVQVLYQPGSVIRSLNFRLFMIVAGVIIIAAAFVLRFPYLGWSGGGQITGGMLTTASFCAFSVLFDAWIIRREWHGRIGTPT